jgi:hypothetical protein
MSRDLLVEELVDRLLEARHAELVAENRALRARLAAEQARHMALATARQTAHDRRAAGRAARLQLVEPHGTGVGA